ncbi:MAG: alpha-hydroxy-acid oxidizing protein [Proteobacteria bacterium]|nr:alpha-hydroxy-acid oxidizing protein [Pseudomonadota bacterium]
MPEAPHLTEPSGDYQTLQEFVRDARLRLPENIWDYLVGATETETTMRRNRLALDQLAFRPRVCRNVENVDCTASLFGRALRLPVMLAPVGSLESFDPGGAATAAEGASSFGVPIMVSSVTKPGLEESAAASGQGPRIFQLYVRGDDAWTDDYVRRAAAAGYDAFCITVDTASYSRRERDIVRRFVKPWRASATGVEYQAAFSWDNVKHFKDTHAIPLILKGIATAEDAALACEHGVDCVYVSNHGGRQLDHGRGAIDVLPEVIEAVRGRARVVIDGGFCRGTDVVKAMALGADAVAVGRLYCYALAAAGASGVVRMLELLETEIAIALALLGVTRLGELTRAHLCAAPSVTAPHVHSAFPLLSTTPEVPR